MCSRFGFPNALLEAEATTSAALTSVAGKEDYGIPVGRTSKIEISYVAPYD